MTASGGLTLGHLLVPFGVLVRAYKGDRPHIDCDKRVDFAIMSLCLSAELQDSPVSE